MLAAVQVEERIRALGFSEEDTRTLTDHFLDAERRGKRGHGLARIDWLESLTGLDPSAEPECVVAEACYERWEGRGALGYLTLGAICAGQLEDPPEAARLIVAHDCFPTGMLGYWARRIAAGGLLAVLTGLACGALNGLLTVRFAIPSFIVTLGMLEVARGATYLITRSQTQYVGARVETLAEGAVLGLSLPFLAAVGLVALGQFVLSRTVFGRYAAAIGTNEEAVRLAGIDPRPVKVAVFMLAGALAGLAGIVNTARLGAADPNAGIGFELQAIAAVVVGGTSLMGGRGSVVGSFLGVLVIAVLASGLAQAGAQEPAKRLVTGAVIVAAAVADALRRRQ